jgi:hypothetical protein
LPGGYNELIISECDGACQEGCFQLYDPRLYLIGIGDLGEECWSYPGRFWLTGESPPEDATVTRVQYAVHIAEDEYDESGDFRCSDYEVYIDTDTDDTDPGVCVYDNRGGVTDGGYDDDPENDADIDLQWRETHAFDGQPAMQTWRLCIADTTPGGAGHAWLFAYSLRICWESCGDE